MLTSKAFSTISYNTEEFLKSTLERLLKQGIINEWYYIFHKGELDAYTQEREKDHFHVYMNPSKRLDTDALRELFKELDKSNPKPLGCMPCQSSKLDDWVMYGVHDADYLATKGEVKEFSYSWKQIRGYDDEAIKRAVKHASAKVYNELRKRSYVKEYGTARAFEQGVIKTSEIMGYMMLERQYSTTQNEIASLKNMLMSMSEENKKLRKENKKLLGDRDGFVPCQLTIFEENKDE